MTGDGAARGQRQSSRNQGGSDDILSESPVERPDGEDLKDTRKKVHFAAEVQRREEHK